jgi:hypothetical protein
VGVSAVTAEASSESTAASEWAKTACILCENNCGIQVELDGRRFAKIRGDKEHVHTRGYTCNKALRLDHYQNGGRRLTSPLRRELDGTYSEVDWDTALRDIATRLRTVRDTYGGESIFFYGGGGQGNHLGGAYRGPESLGAYRVKATPASLRTLLELVVGDDAVVEPVRDALCGDPAGGPGRRLEAGRLRALRGKKRKLLRNRVVLAVTFVGTGGTQSVTRPLRVTSDADLDLAGAAPYPEPDRRHRSPTGERSARPDLRQPVRPGWSAAAALDEAAASISV